MVLTVDTLQNMIGIISAAEAQFAVVGDGPPKKICNLENFVVYTDVSKFYNWIDRMVLETQINL